MKTVLSCLAFTAFILMSSFTLNQQQELNESQNSCFSHFRVHRQGKACVSLNWGVADPTVNQFVVERSYDGEFFENVNTVPFNGSGKYQYLDQSIFPGFIHYRITAIMSDGSIEHTPVEMIRIVQRG